MHARPYVLRERRPKRGDLGLVAPTGCRETEPEFWPTANLARNYLAGHICPFSAPNSQVRSESLLKDEGPLVLLFGLYVR